MDKNGKIGGKVNILDIFLVLAVLIAAIGISMRFISTPSKNAKETIKVSFVVEIEGVRKYSIDALSKKGTVIDIKRKYKVGEIKDFSYKPQEIQALDATGKIVNVEVPERYTAKVTIEADCKESESGYYIGDDLELLVGSNAEIATKYANCTGKVVSIDRVQ